MEEYRETALYESSDTVQHCRAYAKLARTLKMLVREVNRKKT
jgi:hypothetical protein